MPAIATAGCMFILLTCRRLDGRGAVGRPVNAQLQMSPLFKAFPGSVLAKLYLFVFFCFFLSFLLTEPTLQCEMRIFSEGNLFQSDILL